MNDYISKESVNRIILEAIRYCDNQSDKTDDLTLKFSWDKCSGILESVKESVDNIPNADVRPVVYGEWKTSSDRPDTLICSICGCGYDMWKHDPHNFCPNCGADMRGVE